MLRAILLAMVASVLTMGQIAQAQEQIGRYQIVTNSGPAMANTIMVDTTTGRTWALLAQPIVWMPVSFVDQPKAIHAPCFFPTTSKDGTCPVPQ
jgi:hypothetical protein